MDVDVKEKFDSYPGHIRNRLIEIRAIIFEVAEDEEIGEVAESLKWSQPSYTSKSGSPVRMDWKPKNPDSISIYFNCKTSLIETFREIYGNSFKFIGNREIVLPLSENMPIAELRDFISMSLRYHSVKHLPLLGA